MLFYSLSLGRSVARAWEILFHSIGFCRILKTWIDTAVEPIVWAEHIPSHSQTDTLIPNVMVFGGEPFGRWLSYVMGVETPRWDECLIKREKDEHVLSGL